MVDLAPGDRRRNNTTRTQISIWQELRTNASKIPKPLLLSPARVFDHNEAIIILWRKARPTFCAGCYNNLMGTDGIGLEANTRSRQGLNRRIAASFRPYLAQVIIVGLLIFITASLGVVNPLLIRVIFDSGLFPPSGSPNLNLLWIIAGIMAGITVVTGSIGIAQTYLTNQVGQRVMRDLRDRLYRHLQSLSLSFFTGTRTGEIQSRVTNDVGGVQNVVTSTVTDIISNIVILISTVVALSILSWQLTIVAVGIVPVFAFLTKIIGERRRAISAEVQESTAQMTAITQETLSISGIMLSKLFGRQAQEIGRFHDENQHLTELVMHRQMTGQTFWAVMQTFSLFLQ